MARIKDLFYQNIDLKKIFDKAHDRELILQAAMELIPTIGGSLSTLYFGGKQEKRLKRLEKFLSELIEQVTSTQAELADLSLHDSDELRFLLESLFEKVEVETREQKVRLLKEFLLTTLQYPVNSNFDMREHFLDTLSAMSVFECELLGFLFQDSKKIQIRQISKSNASPYMVFAAVNKLRSYGFIESRRGSFQLNGEQDENLDDIIFVSELGIQFCEYVKIV
jgi:hypothetical protein